MKAEELLEIIGGVDEKVLSDVQPRRSAVTWKVILAAAIVIALAATALAAGIYLQSRPVGKVQVQNDPTLTPFALDEEGNVIRDPNAGVLIMMETEYDALTPAYLEEVYEISLPEGWKRAPHGKGSGDGWTMDTWENSWERKDQPGWILLGQTVARRHEAYGENCVDVLYALDTTLPITTEKVQLAGLEMLKVTIPAHDAEQKNYCQEGETRLYWCDGRYILYFTYPTWMVDSQAEQLLLTLTVRKADWSYPENYGNIDPERIVSGSGSFQMEGLTVPQYEYLYCDGAIWFGQTENLIRYEVATDTWETISLADSDPVTIHPRYLYDAGDYIGFYCNDTQYRIRKDGKSPPEAIGEGFFFQFFYDMWHYACEDQAIVRTHILTGEKQTLAEGVSAISEREGKILASPVGTEDEYWIFDLDCKAYEVLPGEKAGEISVGGIPVNRENARNLTVCGDRLYYQPEGSGKYTLCVYDPFTDTTETVAENVFSYAVLEERYLIYTETGKDGKTRGDTHVFTDLQTGESRKFDFRE